MVFFIFKVYPPPREVPLNNCLWFYCNSSQLLALVLVLVKMNISQPVPSAIGSVDFGFLTAEEIKALSVKKIENPLTFDTLLHPIPGGLYDPALGAWGDNM
jgi:hypothetical protein